MEVWLAHRSLDLRLQRQCANALALAGARTTAELGARWGGDNVPEGFIRMSVGCEDAGDLIEDVRQALDRVC
jgi:cystathionine gamma-lyase